MICKIMIDNGITLPADKVSYEFNYNENIKFEVYCEKFVDFKLINHRQFFDITIKHKFYGAPNIEIICDGEISNKYDVVKLFNKVLISLKK